MVSICIPPLRKRRDEISIFIDHFLRKYSQEEGKEVNSISREVMDILMKHDYQGNVRELENIIQRAVVLARGKLITTDDLSPHIRKLRSEKDEIMEGSLVKSVESMEKRMILDALKESEGNQSRAARSLGITERNLRYKMKKYGMK